MFKVRENGTLIEIPDNAFGYIYKCYIPPIGYGINVITRQLEKTDVYKRSSIQEEQYWERILLPSDYNDRRKKEAERQRIDKLFIDPYLEDIRIKEWNRRLCGVWFYNNGEPVYITGTHYLYINWWKFQGKFNDYRLPDRDSFYVWDYCVEDPCCLGLNEIMNRKSGKTARAGCILYERTSRMPNSHGGIQSKTDSDGWEVFKKAVVHPWKKLPHFFRPIYDLMKGDDPNDELRFFATSRRGQQAELEAPEEALDSWIDYKSSEESAYDGPELDTYVSDETSKTKKDVSIIERQNVARYCCEINGVFKGKSYYTTTVEIDEDEEEHPEFQELTAMSNPLDRDDNGRTMTGLYTYFRPAYKSLFFDRYGNPDEEKAKAYLTNTRSKYEKEGKLRQLSSFKRKQPMTFKEAFSVDGKTALFNPELINIQIDEVSWRKDLTEKGNLEWEDGYRLYREVDRFGEKTKIPAKIIWVPNPNGRWTKVIGWMPKEPNKVSLVNEQYIPNANYQRRIGCDPFKFDKTKDKRRSDCVAYNYEMPDHIFPSKYDDMFTLEYAYRPETTQESNEDILKMVWWCGCQVLFERNVNHWKKYFQENNCSGFLMYLPHEDEPGVYTDGKGTTVQAICNYTSSYINDHIAKCFFLKLMGKDKGWLGFKVEETQKYDNAMAGGVTLIAVKGKNYANPAFQQKNIEDYLPPIKVA